MLRQPPPFPSHPPAASWGAAGVRLTHRGCVSKLGCPRAAILLLFPLYKTPNPTACLQSILPTSWLFLHYCEQASELHMELKPGTSVMWHVHHSECPAPGSMLPWGLHCLQEGNCCTELGVPKNDGISVSAAHCDLFHLTQLKNTSQFNCFA